MSSLSLYSTCTSLCSYHVSDISSGSLYCTNMLLGPAEPVCLDPIQACPGERAGKILWNKDEHVTSASEGEGRRRHVYPASSGWPQFGLAAATWLGGSCHVTAHSSSLWLRGEGPQRREGQAACEWGSSCGGQEGSQGLHGSGNGCAPRPGVLPVQPGWRRPASPSLTGRRGFEARAAGCSSDSARSVWSDALQVFPVPSEPGAHPRNRVLGCVCAGALGKLLPLRIRADDLTSHHGCQAELWTRRRPFVVGKAERPGLRVPSSSRGGGWDEMGCRASQQQPQPGPLSRGRETSAASPMDRSLSQSPPWGQRPAGRGQAGPELQRRTRRLHPEPLPLSHQSLRKRLTLLESQLPHQCVGESIPTG